MSVSQLAFGLHSVREQMFLSVAPNRKWHQVIAWREGAAAFYGLMFNEGCLCVPAAQVSLVAHSETRNWILFHRSSWSRIMDNVWKQLYLNACKVFWVPHDSPAGYSGTVVVIHFFRNPLKIKDSHRQAFKALVIPQLLLKAVWVPCQMCCMLESHNTSMSSHTPRVLCWHTWSREVHKHNRYFLSATVNQSMSTCFFQDCDMFIWV